MAHLGSEVAAYVDGQLPASAMIAARHHLRECESCALAVLQQSTLKTRVKQVNAPEPPHELLASHFIIFFNELQKYENLFTISSFGFRICKIITKKTHSLLNTFQ